MKCLEILKRCQSVEARLDYGFDWTRTLSRRWQRDRPFDAGVVVRPEVVVTGFEYISSGGQSGEEEPNWPRVLGATVVDGSITWTTQVISADSLIEEIASDTWFASVPAGLTVEPAVPTMFPGLQMTKVILSGGEVGQMYVVENEMVTTQDYEYMARIILTIE